MDLSQPPSPTALDDEEDDFDDEYVPVTARKREKLLGKSSYILIAALVAVGGFIGGAKWKEHHTSSASGTGANTAANGLPAFGAGGFPNRTGTNATGTPTGATANGNLGGGATVGTIKLVDGTNVYVEDAQGNIVKVTTGADTTVQVSKTGAVSDLKAGDNVIVQGTTGTDGNIAATTITSGNTLGVGNRNRQTTTTTTTAPAG